MHTYGLSLYPTQMYDKQELFFALLEIRNGEKNESEK